MIAGSIFLLFKITNTISALALPQGTTFVLNPRGFGILFDVAVSLAVIALALLVYNLLTSEKHLANIFCKALFFVAMIIGLSFLQGQGYIAVVKTENQCVFIRPLPWGNRTASDKTLEARINESGMTRTLEVKLGEETISSRPVYSIDTETMKTLDELVKDINSFK